MVEWADVEAKILDVSGHLHPGQERWLYEAARGIHNHQAIILEIGSYKGRSTTALAAGCLASSKHVYTIDTFRGLPGDTDVQGELSFLGEFMGNLEKVGITSHVTPLIGFSSEYYDAWDKPIEMLWIDGGHDYEVVRDDFNAFFKWLKPDGLLAMHDVYHLTPSTDVVKPDGPDRVWWTISHLLKGIGLMHNLAWGTKR